MLYLKNYLREFDAPYYLKYLNGFTINDNGDVSSVHSNLILGL